MGEARVRRHCHSGQMIVNTGRAPRRLRGPTLLAVVLTLGMGFLTGSADAAASITVPSAPVPAAAGRPGDEAPGYPWHWPVEGRRLVMIPFRAPAHDYGPGHRGMDVAAGPGSVVRAPAAGVIAFRGTIVDRPLITIDHGDGYITTLEPVRSELSPGDAVAGGDPVGVVDTGGHAPRGTVHVGVRLDGRYVNPRGLFGGPPRAILLPCCEG